MLVLTNIYKDMGAIMSQFMTKIMLTSCCLQYCLQVFIVVFPDHTHLLFLPTIFDGFAFSKANSVNL